MITYFSLAAGKYRSEADFAKSARGAGMKKFLNPRGINILDALDAVDRRYDVTPAQISLAWLTSRPDVTAPIASATTLDQLQKILGATEVELDAETVGKLEGASV